MRRNKTRVRKVEGKRVAYGLTQGIGQNLQNTPNNLIASKLC